MRVLNGVATCLIYGVPTFIVNCVPSRLSSDVSICLVSGIPTCSLNVLARVY